MTVSDDDGIKIVRYGEPGERELVLCTVENLGHEWPGARRTLPQAMTGPTRDKPVAIDLISDFFKRHRLPATRRSDSAAPQGR